MLNIKVNKDKTKFRIKTKKYKSKNKIINRTNKKMLNNGGIPVGWDLGSMLPKLVFWFECHDERNWLYFKVYYPLDHYFIIFLTRSGLIRLTKQSRFVVQTLEVYRTANLDCGVVNRC